MIFGVIRKGLSGIIVHESSNELIAKYCKDQRSRKDSKCQKHYDSLWALPRSNTNIDLCKCPYGLVTTTGLGGETTPIILSGFWTKENGGDIPKEITSAAKVDTKNLNNILFAISSISSGIRQEGLDHFEAALHDTRHLNHAISLNAEQLLNSAGYPPDTDWDLAAVQRDEAARRALAIYSASRDLSLSMMMHEISRDQTQATRDIIQIPIHKIFYRQLKISAERLDQAGISYVLGNTLKTTRLSSAFKLIPKIIIDNSIKYASRGSKIQIFFNENSNYFIIECKNHGSVVKDDETTEVFNRGFRGSNKTGITGQGIGLWLAKTIIEANKGHISLSIKEQGRDYSGRRLGETTITIKIPR